VAEVMKLEMGLKGEIFDTPPIFECLVTEIWLKILWLDCVKYGLTIQTDLSDFSPPFSNDIELIQLFAQQGFLVEI